MVCLGHKQLNHWEAWKDRTPTFASETTLNQDKFPAEIAFEFTPLHYNEEFSVLNSLYKQSKL